MRLIDIAKEVKAPIQYVWAILNRFQVYGELGWTIDGANPDKLEDLSRE